MSTVVERLPEVLAIVPARGGSKGIPHKNIAPLGGKPLIAYTIAAALAAASLTRVVVSTDDAEIAAVAEDCGAEVPFLRPPAIAGSASLLEDCFRHVLSGLSRRENYAPVAVVFLYCTSPFRTPALIDALTAKLLDGHSDVVTARRFVSRGYGVFRLPGGETSRPVSSLRLRPGGCASYFRSYGVYSGRLLRPSTRGRYVHAIDDPCMLVDIDTPEDLRLAEGIVRNNLFDFGLS